MERAIVRVVPRVGRWETDKVKSWFAQELAKRIEEAFEEEVLEAEVVFE